MAQQVEGNFQSSSLSDTLKNNQAAESHQRSEPIQNTLSSGQTVTCKFVDLAALRKSPRFGVKRYPDSCYEGELIGSRRDGQGIMTYSNGRIYEGGWANDSREGKGFERYANGNTYEGEYSKGQPCGKGIYMWSNGEVYDGEWRNGLKHGDGIWKGTNGDSYIGEWRMSKAEGYGVHVWKNGFLQCYNRV